MDGDLFNIHQGRIFSFFFLYKQKHEGLRYKDVFVLIISLLVAAGLDRLEISTTP